MTIYLQWTIREFDHHFNQHGSLHRTQEVPYVTYVRSFRSYERMRRPVWPDAEIKSISKVAQKLIKDDFTRKVMLFKRAQKVTELLGYFWRKICSQELSKIVQSGHTGPDPMSKVFTLSKVKQVENVFTTLLYICLIETINSLIVILILRQKTFTFRHYYSTGLAGSYFDNVVTANLQCLITFKGPRIT